MKAHLVLLPSVILYVQASMLFDKQLKMSNNKMPDKTSKDNTSEDMSDNPLLQNFGPIVCDLFNDNNKA